MDRLYNAMDVFVLPSLFEGLPVVGLEAQANGLEAFFSENVSRETGIAQEGVRFLPLKTETWVQALRGVSSVRRDNAPALRAAGYDIETESARLQDFYLQSKTAGRSETENII